MVDARVKYIPSNTFSYYDKVFDTTAMLGAVPPRYGWSGEEIVFDIYFSMARGNAILRAMEMTKWFDTNYYYIVPELSPELTFTYVSHKAVNGYKEAKELGIDMVPVLVGPVPYLLLSEPAKSVRKTFNLLSLLDSILPIYKGVISELKAAGATLAQLDEPSLVLDLEAHQLEAFSRAYSYLEEATEVKIVVETYFSDIPVETYKSEACMQISLAIKDEVEDLEAGGIQVIQIDEAALREGLPLCKSEHAFYLDWAVHGFRIINCGVKDSAQIHTHMYYSNFNDIIHSIVDMDADVITIENSRSDEKLLSVFREGVKYGAAIDPGVYDIHSPRIPSTEESADHISKMLAVLESNILWVNPDCGLKTRKYHEVLLALTAMVAAAKFH